MDVYYPSDETEGPAPILFFVYGGGFLMGSRDVIPGLVYDNLGAFFAQRGILTVIADYRLAPAAVYPEPVEDLRDAFKFVLSELAGHDKTRVYVAGHSAGACHVMTFFLNEDILREEDRRVFRGAVLMGGLYANAPPPVNVYYGPEEDHTEKTPFGLLRSHLAAKVTCPSLSYTATETLSRPSNFFRPDCLYSTASGTPPPLLPCPKSSRGTCRTGEFLSRRIS